MSDPTSSSGAYGNSTPDGAPEVHDGRTQHLGYDHAPKVPLESNNKNVGPGSFPDDKIELEDGQCYKLDQSQTHATLERLGLETQMEKRMGPFAILCVGYNICNSWVGIAATVVLSLETGGSVTLLYGILVIVFAMGCSAATMAELASVYPTAGGPYHWTSILAPKSTSRLLSYICAAFNLFGWLSVSAGVCIQTGLFISAMRWFYNPSLDIPAWQIFLFYQAFNIVIMLNNIFVLRRTKWIHDVGFVFTLSSFVIVLVTCLARAESFASNKFVWTTFDPPDWTWNSRLAVFLIGLVNPNYMYAGIDGVIHLAEECSNASQAVPRALFSTIVIGFVTAFPFVIAMLYCIVDFDAAADTPTEIPIYEIWYQATRSRTAATAFMVAFLMIVLFAFNACQEVTARLTWAFARDNAIIGSRFLKQIHPTLQVPVWALIANAIVIAIIGFIYLGSTTAFNAFIGTGLLLQQCSYGIPAALLLWNRRSANYLPTTRAVRLGFFGWIANIVTVIFAFLTTIVYCFPTELPVTGSSMNYAVAVVGVMAIASVINWFVYSRKHFQGPRLQEGFLH